MIQDISLGLLETYKGKINTYDEVLDQNSQVKPYWQGLFDTLESIGIDELTLYLILLTIHWTFGYFHLHDMATLHKIGHKNALFIEHKALRSVTLNG